MKRLLLTNVSCLPFLCALVLCGAEPAPDKLAREFERPAAEWKSRPLWFWNGPLDQQKTTQIMEHSLASGYHGFGILPTPAMTQSSNQLRWLSSCS